MGLVEYKILSEVAGAACLLVLSVLLCCWGSLPIGGLPFWLRHVGGGPRVLPHSLVPRDWAVQKRSWSTLCIHSLCLMELLRSQGTYSYMAVYPSLPPIVVGVTFSRCYEAGAGGSGRG